jgi:hypothetical protein
MNAFSSDARWAISNNEKQQTINSTRI